MISMVCGGFAAHQMAFDFEELPAKAKKSCAHEYFFSSHAFTPVMLVCGGCGYPWFQYLPNKWDKDRKEKEGREYTTTDRPWDERTVMSK